MVTDIIQPNFDMDPGWIEVITGCVYSGKTEELIRRITQMKYAGRKFQVFRADPSLRKPSPDLVSHSGLSIPAVPARRVEDILSELLDGTEMIAIDEIHFYKLETIPPIFDLVDKGMRILLAGLDLDFRGEPFIAISSLLARAEFILKRHAVCAKCGKPATRSQRLINGKPAPLESPIIMRGAPAVYEPRCRRCHQVPKNG